MSYSKSDKPYPQGRIKFLTKPSWLNPENVTQDWYLNGPLEAVSEFLENPTDYQQSKIEKHTGSMFMFDKSFTSKYPGVFELNRATTETAINGTLGSDPQGRPCIWLEHNRVVGEIRARPEDSGTVCTKTKIVGLSPKSDAAKSIVHSYPFESEDGYQMYLLVADIWKPDE